MPDMATPGDPADDQPHITLLVVDDHEVFAQSLTRVLAAESDIGSVGTAATLARAAELVPELRPDVLLLDVRLPDGDGIAAIPDLRALHADMSVVVLTASSAEHVLVRAIEAGASGYLAKTAGIDEVTAAVRAAAAKEAVIPPDMLARLLPRLRRRHESHSVDLTERELEVLHLLARGMQNSAIAAKLHVSPHTVRNHIANLSMKLGAHSKLEALSIAIRTGVISV